MAHVDEFCVGLSSSPSVVLFGGSGIDEIEYEARSQTTPSVFDGLLSQFASTGLPCHLVHVTAPYDVPIRRLHTDASAAEAWTRHVVEEVIPSTVANRFVVAGFSGGAMLALSGVDRCDRCIGGAVFGADGLSLNWRRPTHWSQPLDCYIAKDDRVTHAPENRLVSQALARRGDARLHAVAHGHHRLIDYATPAVMGESIGLYLQPRK
jgi:hypothetical protein